MVLDLVIILYGVSVYVALCQGSTFCIDVLTVSSTVFIYLNKKSIVFTTKSQHNRHLFYHIANSNTNQNF